MEPANIDVKNFAEQWLDRKRLDVQLKTFASYEETVKRYIVKGIGTLRVRDVESEDVEAMLQQAVAKSTRGQLSGNTLRIIRATCSLLLKDAIKRLKLDVRNPCEDLDVKLGTLSQAERQQSVRDRVMTYEQLARVLRAAKQHCTRRDFMLFLALAETGARPSEELALRWSDVDIDRRTLRVERAVSLGGQIKPTKTKAMRTVRLTVPLAEALAAWRRHVERAAAKAKVSPPAFMFPSRSGQPLRAKPIGRCFRALLRKTDLPSSLTLYSLRHTFASQLLDQGVKPVDVARVMGHKNVTTTLTFYAHAIPQDDTPYIDRLTAARQAAGDAAVTFVKTSQRSKTRNAGKSVVSRQGFEPCAP